MKTFYPLVTKKWGELAQSNLTHITFWYLATKWDGEKKKILVFSFSPMNTDRNKYHDGWNFLLRRNSNLSASTVRASSDRETSHNSTRYRIRVIINSYSQCEHDIVAGASFPGYDKCKRVCVNNSRFSNFTGSRTVLYFYPKHNFWNKRNAQNSWTTAFKRKQSNLKSLNILIQEKYHLNRCNS